MARGVNKVILIGNLGQDPEIRFLPNGNPVANITIATSESWTDRQSGQRQERTEWHRVVMFSKLAEIAQQYVKKGTKLYIEGKLQTRKWTDQQGIDRYSTEIVASSMEMLSGSPTQQQGGNQPQQGGQPQQSQPNQQPQQSYQQPPQQNTQQGGNQPQQQPQNSAPQNQPNQNYGAPNPGSFDDFDDEIPF